MRSMSFRIKLFILLLICFGCQLFAQQDSLTYKRPKSTIEIGASQLYFFGDNFMSEAYDFSTGFHLGLAIEVIKNGELRFAVASQGSSSIDQTLVGNIDATRSSQFEAGFAYIWPIIDRIYITPEVSVGYLKLKNSLRDQEFRDDGYFTKAGFKATYNFWDQLAIYTNLGFGLYWFEIETAAQEQDFFDTAQALSLSFGLQFSFR